MWDDWLLPSLRILPRAEPRADRTLACALNRQSSDHSSAKTLKVPREPGDLCQPLTTLLAIPSVSLTALPESTLPALRKSPYPGMNEVTISKLQITKLNVRGGNAIKASRCAEPTQHDAGI